MITHNIYPRITEEQKNPNTKISKNRYVLYSGSREAANVTISPAEAEAFYRANPVRYTHGEQRNLKYLVADTRLLKSQMVPSGAQLRARYDATKESDFKRPESAHILHILLKLDPSVTPAQDEAARIKAESLIKQLRGGADFAALARANSQDPSSSGNGGDMGYIDKGATVDVFDQAAFTMPLNTISDPIRSKEFGYHIIKVLDRKPAGYRTFDEVRTQLANQMADQMSKDQAREEINRVSAAIRDKKPASAADFSARAGGRVTSNDTQWFQKGDQIPGLGSNPQLATWAFAAKPGDVSEILGTSRGPIIAYLAGVRAAGVTPLSDIRDKVTNDARMEKARALARLKLAAAMPGAATVDAVGAKVSATPLEANVSHQSFIVGIPGDTAALVNEALSAPVGQLRGPVVAGDGAVVFQVLSQKRVTPGELAGGRQQMLDQLRVRESRALRSSLLQRMRKSSKIDINEKVLEQQKSGENPAA
jgi:peptidyl-prolyl cis-trans isomerase D